jgi:hypothetical protein
MSDADHWIRHLAVADRTNRVAAARFERTVAIWDLETRQRLSVFDTILDFGGRRLALSSDGSRCVAGAYRVHGVACYTTEDGRLLWQRRELKRVQRITISPDGSRVFCAFEDAPCAVLDAQSGDTLERWRGVRRVVCGPFAPLYLCQGNGYEIRGDFDVILTRLHPESFGLLNAAFGPDVVCLTESAGPVRAFGSIDGIERWRHRPPPRHHVLDVAFRSGRNDFLGVQWNYQAGGPYELYCWDAQTGDSQHVVSFEPVATFAFCNGGDALLLADGRLLDTNTGQVVDTLDLEGRVE